MRPTITIPVASFPPLWVGDVPYDLRVFGPYPDGDFDVEVYIEDKYVGTKTLPRNTHVIADMMDFVMKCVHHKGPNPLVEY